MKNRWLVWAGISLLYHLILLLLLSQVRFGTISGRTIKMTMQLIKEVPQQIAQKLSTNNNTTNSVTPVSQNSQQQQIQQKEVSTPVQQKQPTEQPTQQATEQKSAPSVPIVPQNLYRPEQNLPDYQQNSMNRSDYASAPSVGGASSGISKLSPGQTGSNASTAGSEANSDGGLSPDANNVNSGKVMADGSGGSGYSPSREPTGLPQIGQQFLTSDRGEWVAPAGNGGNNPSGRMARLTPGANRNNNNSSGNGIGINNGDGIAPGSLGASFNKFAANAADTNYRGDNNIVNTTNSAGAGRGTSYDKPMQIASNPNSKISPTANSRGAGSGGGNGVGINTNTGVAPTGTGIYVGKSTNNLSGNGTGYRGDSKLTTVTNDNGNGNGRGTGFDKPMQIASNSRGKISPQANSRSNGSGSGNGVGIRTGSGVAPTGSGGSVGKSTNNLSGNGTGYRGEAKIVVNSNDNGNGNGRGGGYDLPAQKIASNPRGKISIGGVSRGDGNGNGIGLTTTMGTGVGLVGGGISDRGGAGTVIGGLISFGNHDIGGKLMPGGSPLPGGRGNLSDAPANGNGDGNGKIISSGRGGVSYEAEIAGLAKIGKVPSIIEEENLLGRIPGKSCTVTAEVKVGTSGQAITVTLVKSTPFNTINNNAIYIARKIEYRPGMINGLPSPTTIRLEIKYIDGKHAPEIKVK